MALTLTLVLALALTPNQVLRDGHAAALALAEENAARLRRSLEMQALEQKELERQLRDKELQLRRAQQAQEDVTNLIAQVSLTLTN